MLDRIVEQVRAGLKTGQYQNEAAVCQGIILPLLGALGWDRDDTQVVSPQHTVPNGRVDFALCHPPGKPLVFIEAKQVGLSGGGALQLFQYAFHGGVPLVVLTDGREWSFFLPAGAGSYDERRVYTLNLLERDVGDSVERFERYLRYETVCSGNAIAAAQADYKDIAREREILRALPQAWLKLVDEQDASLIEILGDRVETLCGYRPNPDTTARFLAQGIRLQQASGVGSALVPASGPPVGPTKLPASRGKSSPLGFTIHGQFWACKNAREVLVSVVESLAERDATFLDRFVELPQHGRKRRYVARDRNDLYPGRPDLAEDYAHQLRSGHWLGTNYGRREIRDIIRVACEVAGLGLGTDLSIELGD